MEAHKHCHHHHEAVDEKSVRLLLISFIINMGLSAVEFIGGIVSGSMALIGDALHNTSDALSILIAVIAFRIGHKKATEKYTYGFKRAEVIGGFVNLILLFISGVYLLVEGIFRLVKPEPISGAMIVVISVLALIIDAATAKISHHHAAHNSNMKMVFLHNFADALGSFGVIISGFCVMWLDVFWVDGMVAIGIAVYMIVQAIISFPDIVHILMNAAPDDVDLKELEKAILKVEGVKGVHHIHLWRVSEHDSSLECHIEACKGRDLLVDVKTLLAEQFNIMHSTIQIEDDCADCDCEL
jgi:cobalt-zinc-cadmium efflux system protein